MADHDASGNTCTGDGVSREKRKLSNCRKGTENTKVLDKLEI